MLPLFPRASITRASDRHRRSNLLYRLLLGLLIVLTIAPSAWPLPLHAQSSPLVLIVDTDPGVDDALALTWLLSQRERPIQFLGIVSVFGNTSRDSAANNILTVLEMNNRTDIPVYRGSETPLTQSPTLTGWFIHGPDGLWGLSASHPHDVTALPDQAVTFYCQMAAAYHGATILALGPLTNLARAAAACPTDLATMRIVVLGGAKFGGNKSAVAEFNFWQDPEAVQQVLDSGLRPQIVPFDAFGRLSVNQQVVDKLLRKGNGAVQMLSGAINQYAAVQMQNGGAIAFPDLAAAVFAAEAAPASALPALIEMTVTPARLRGQSVVALSIPERLALIADETELNNLALQAFTDPAFNLQTAFGTLLARRPDNAQWVSALDSKSLLQAIERGLNAP